ncbi:MAG: thioredoxin family protein [Ignavibacteria bacterium]|nr:thioredoxin family protein [Ignavibacteria bacterium]
MTSLRIVTIFLVAFAGCRAGENPEPARPELRSAQQQTPAASATAVPELTASTIDAAIASGSYTFLEFGGKSCKPCKQMQPILRDLRARYPKLTVGNIYMENSRDLLEKWKIQLIPTQVLLGPDKKEIMRHVGLWEMKDILAAFKKHHVAL